MITRFVEVTDGIAYGKFLVCRMTSDELATKTAMPEADGALLLNYAGRRRFNGRTTFVIDLQIGSGFAWPLENGRIGFEHHLNASDRLRGEKRVLPLVCPLYLTFVLWLHEQGTWANGAGNLDDIPRYIELPGAEEARRSFYEALAEPFDPDKLDPVGPGPGREQAEF